MEKFPAPFNTKITSFCKNCDTCVKQPIPLGSRKKLRTLFKKIERSRKELRLTNGFYSGMVGLPNVGKSILFNAITATGAEASNYPICTINSDIDRLGSETAVKENGFMRVEEEGI